MPPDDPPKDDPTALGSLDRRELALIVVTAAITIVMVTFSVAVIMGLMNPNTDIVITGTIDLGKFEGTVFTIVGAGILLLGITTGPKIAAALKT